MVAVIEALAGVPGLTFLDVSGNAIKEEKTARLLGGDTFAFVSGVFRRCI